MRFFKDVLLPLSTTSDRGAVRDPVHLRLEPVPVAAAGDDRREHVPGRDRHQAHDRRRRRGHRLERRDGHRDAGDDPAGAGGAADAAAGSSRAWSTPKNEHEQHTEAAMGAISLRNVVKRYGTGAEGEPGDPRRQRRDRRRRVHRHRRARRAAARARCCAWSPGWRRSPAARSRSPGASSTTSSRPSATSRWCSRTTRCTRT